MKSKNFIREAEGEAYDIAKRFKNRDFSGNTGKAIKNSTFDISRTVVAKFGSILFTIIVARLLMPELFGLYGLALSTILMISSLSDLGVSGALTPYLSRFIDKEKGKAKGYYIHIMRMKLVLTLFGSILILISAHYFANIFYQKPIFYALIAGAIYFPLASLPKYLGSIFVSKNDFKVDFYGEIFFQIIRLSIIPLLILYFIKDINDYNISLLYIILGLTFCFLVTSIYYICIYFIKKPFGKAKSVSLKEDEKKEVYMFILPLTLTIFAGVFFGYVDTIMLGHYVESSFIAYYQAAFNLIASASVIISFAGASMLPIFSRLKGVQLKRGFRKARLITFLISICALIFTQLVAPYVIWIVYGEQYLQSVIFLRLLSLLLISFPLTSIYQSYYSSQKKTKEFSIMLFVSTILNIILNYFFIKVGLSFGMTEAVIGACTATIISRYTYLFGLAVYKKKIEKEFKS